MDKKIKQAAKQGLIGAIQALCDRAAAKPFLPKLKLVQRFRARFGRLSVEQLEKAADETEKAVRELKR